MSQLFGVAYPFFKGALVLGYSRELFFFFFFWGGGVYAFGVKGFGFRAPFQLLGVSDGLEIFAGFEGFF